MVFRRWDPGLCLRDWVVTGIQEHASDSQKRGFQSDHLGIILGFNKDIWVRLWKSKISMDWIGYPFGINMESWNNKGSLLVSDLLQYLRSEMIGAFSIFSLIIVGISRHFQGFGVWGGMDVMGFFGLEIGKYQFAEIWVYGERSFAGNHGQ